MAVAPGKAATYIVVDLWNPRGGFLTAFWHTFSVEFRVDCRGVFFIVLINFRINVGCIWASKITLGGTPMRKGRPSIFSSAPMEIKLFEPAGGSLSVSGRPELV